MLDSVVTKAELRALGLARRAGMTEQKRVEGSKAAVARLVPLIGRGETVSLFWPMRGEIDPRGLIDHVASIGGAIAMPVVEKRRMFFRRFTGEECLEDGVFGTRHPHASEPVVDPDFVVAPLAAFDRAGGRIGYGAGYYDQALASLMARGRRLRIAGLCFACQEVDEVPVESHDVRLQMIATEHELVHAGPA
jgi:5-formyltetrahydrofolate cyclo-ligase